MMTHGESVAHIVQQKRKKTCRLFQVMPVYLFPIVQEQFRRKHRATLPHSSNIVPVCFQSIFYVLDVKVRTISVYPPMKPIVRQQCFRIQTKHRIPSFIQVFNDRCRMDIFLIGDNQNHNTDFWSSISFFRSVMVFIRPFTFLVVTDDFKLRVPTIRASYSVI